MNHKVIALPSVFQGLATAYAKLSQDPPGTTTQTVATLDTAQGQYQVIETVTRTVEFRFKDADSALALAETLEGTFMFPGLGPLDKTALLAKIVSQFPDQVQPWLQLAHHCLAKFIRIKNSPVAKLGVKSVQDIFVRALDLDPRNLDVWLELIDTMNDDRKNSCVILSSNLATILGSICVDLNRVTLCKQIIEHLPADGRVWFKLAESFTKVGLPISLLGSVQGKTSLEELYLEALRLKPDFPEAALGLALTMQSKQIETINISGTPTARKALILSVISQKPTLGRAYDALAREMDSSETIVLFGYWKLHGRDLSNIWVKLLQGSPLEEIQGSYGELIQAPPPRRLCRHTEKSRLLES